MNLAEFRCAPYGKALKRDQNKGAKPGYKRKLQIYYKTAKEKAKKCREEANVRILENKANARLTIGHFFYIMQNRKRR